LQPSMHRFFLPQDCFSEGAVAITGRLVHRVRNVLRLGNGDHIIVLDNSGWEYEIELGKVASGRVEGAIVNKSVAAGEPQLRVALYQALLKGSNFEFVLQKCTEIGVASFVPLVCERCVAAEPGDDRVDRWRSIILEAAQQSRRGKLPALHPVTSFREACERAAGLALLPWEGEGSKGIGSVLRGRAQSDDVSDIAIFVGPEGGFTGEEVEYARSAGMMPVSLGKRILRAETAGLVAAAVALYEFGELDAGL
jgi:16S rRNA (uracil1498-N3)-methyltransferase